MMRFRPPLLPLLPRPSVDFFFLLPFLLDFSLYVLGVQQLAHARRKCTREAKIVELRLVV